MLSCFFGLSRVGWDMGGIWILDNLWLLRCVRASSGRSLQWVHAAAAAVGVCIDLLCSLSFIMLGMGWHAITIAYIVQLRAAFGSCDVVIMIAGRGWG